MVKPEKVVSSSAKPLMDSQALLKLLVYCRDEARLQNRHSVADLIELAHLALMGEISSCDNTAPTDYEVASKRFM